MIYRSKLTKAQEQSFWHEQRKSPGIAITARDLQAVKEGKTVKVEQRARPESEEKKR
jgi:hypothetical protein